MKDKNVPLHAPTGAEMPHSKRRIIGRRTKAPDALQKTPHNKTAPQRMVADKNRRITSRQSDAEKNLSADATYATIALAFSIINIRQVATVSFFH